MPPEAVRLVSAEEMRRLDHAAIASGVPAVTLMQRAGAGVAEAIERHYGPSLGLRVLALCGTGNNGGDGFVAARELSVRGAEVHVGVLGDPAKVMGGARVHLDALESAGITPVVVPDTPALERLLALRDRFDFALDALLGTGAHGAPAGIIADGVQALRHLDDSGTHVIAVDLPTGVDADTGAIARRAVRADITVTFGCPKRGHWLYPGRAFVGRLEVVDIGLEATWGKDDDPKCWTTLAAAADMAARVPHRAPRAHKGSTGRVLIAGGAPGIAGAVALAARGAARAGAGYVTAAIPKSLRMLVATKLTEQMTLALPESRSGALSLAALPDLLAHAERADVMVLGSGLSRDFGAAELVRRVTALVQRPLVLDADGLNAFAGRAHLMGAANVPRVVTPHLGEMARLTGLTPDALERDRIDAARVWAERWNVVVVLKGAPTVTASPCGHVTVNSTGNPALATAGTGDVLAGVIAALIGQRLTPYDAARLGVYVHGLSADQWTQANGALGMIAGDVVEGLPGAFSELAKAHDPATTR